MKQRALKRHITNIEVKGAKMLFWRAFSVLILQNLCLKTWEEVYFWMERGIENEGDHKLDKASIVIAAKEKE